MTRHCYAAFGLIIASSREIGSLRRVQYSSAMNTADVWIADGPVSFPSTAQEAMAEIHVARTDDVVYVRVEQVADFAITQDTILIARLPDVTDPQIDMYLLGTVFAVLLYQRALLPIHCNAVEIGGRAFLLCGVSGAGKSTLAAYMEARGHPVLTDDMCALSLAEPTPVALPGIPRVKLWMDAIELLGRQQDSRAALPWYDRKWELPLTRNATAPLSVGGIYHLRESSEQDAPGIRRNTGLDAVNAVTSNIYRRRVADIIGASPFYLHGVVRIVSAVPVFSVYRQWGLEHFDQEAVALERHLRSLVPTATC